MKLELNGIVVWNIYNDMGKKKKKKDKLCDKSFKSSVESIRKGNWR